MALAVLVVGGIFTAPQSPSQTRRLHVRPLLIRVGLVIVTISTFDLWRAPT